MFVAASSTIFSIPKVSTSFISSASNGKNPKVLPSNFPPASRILLKNLSYTTGEASLIKLFSKFGRIVEVKLPKHEETKRSKGYAFIQYTCQDDAVLAMEHMDQKIIDGRIVRADIAKPFKNEFGAYPTSSGPPLHQKLEANIVDDHDAEG